jgi:hypothetical protein
VEVDREHIRIVHLHNTLDIFEFEISESMLEDAKNNPQIEILSESRELVFNEEGNLW